MCEYERSMIRRRRCRINTDPKTARIASNVSQSVSQCVCLCWFRSLKQIKLTSGQKSQPQIFFIHISNQSEKVVNKWVNIRILSDSVIFGLEYITVDIINGSYRTYCVHPTQRIPSWWRHWSSLITDCLQLICGVRQRRGVIRINAEHVQKVKRKNCARLKIV